MDIAKILILGRQVFKCSKGSTHYKCDALREIVTRRSTVNRQNGRLYNNSIATFACLNLVSDYNETGLSKEGKPTRGDEVCCSVTGACLPCSITRESFAYPAN